MAQYPPSNNPDIVVEGKTIETVETFLAQIKDPTQTDQLARWDHRICANVIGLSADQANLIINNLARVASSVGMKVSNIKCSSNVLVIFTEDAGGVAAAIAKRYPNTLSSDGRWRLDRFVRTRQTVRWLAQVAAVSADGGTITRMSGSRLRTSYKSTLTGMLVIVDGQKLRGISLEKMSEYLPMVILTRPTLIEAHPRTSILSAFDHSSSISRMTTWDNKYLSALYRTSPDTPAAAQLGQIKRMMRRGGTGN